MDIGQVVLDRGRYRTLLAQFLGFYGPLEDRIAGAHDWGAEGIDFDNRRKAWRLEEDLRALGMTAAEIAALPRCAAAALPEARDAGTAFGCFYVLEGSTLGGRHISAMLDRGSADIPEEARTFFQGYGRETGPMWKAFCESLESFASRGDGDAIIQGGGDTFRSLQQWMQHPPPTQV